MNRSKVTSTPALAWFALFASVFLLFVALDSRAEDAATEDGDVIVIGAQDTDVDADENRDAKFEKNREFHDGIVLDYFQWSRRSETGWFQIQAWDASQLDEGARLRGGWGDLVEIHATYQSTPNRYGDRAVFVLARGEDDAFTPSFRIADFNQQAFEDPDGNGIPFYTSAPNLSVGPEAANDNPLVFGMMNDLLTGQERFSLRTLRRTGSFGITLTPSRNWSVDLNAETQTRDGVQALGSGTYQRISDVNDNADGTYGDGITDYDYYFSVRGIELPALVDYRTTRFETALNYRNGGWFARVGATFSEFENNHLGITYDNPFWFNGVAAASGSQRGLWEEGRVSLEPSNEAWDLTFAGGMNLPARTRITAAVSIGEHTQDDPFLPITTNGATTGTADINRDGVVDALDDPTLVPAEISGLPASIDGVRTIGVGLDASSDITALNLTVTSRPVKKLRLAGRYRSYDYDGGEGIQVVPARTEYIESKVKLDFKGDLILHVPNQFTRETIGIEAAWRFSNTFKLEGFAKRKSYDYEVYRDPDGNSSRDSGTRAVSGTDDDIFGITALFGAAGWFSGRATFQTAEREFDGTYTPGFSGENPDIRQYDIANRERDAANIQLDFMPSEALTLGVGYRLEDDDYPDSSYGLQAGERTGLDLSLNYAVGNGFNFFAYADLSEWDADMHLRTKCANCSGFTAWTVPNFDWFSGYTDTTTAAGAGVSFDAGGKTKLEFLARYIDGEIEQTTRNPATPVNLQDPADNPRAGAVATVALGFDFPDQTNTLFSTEFKLTRRITDSVSAGFWWLYEDFELDDFQWNNLRPYAQNFLDVRVPGVSEVGDEANRYLFLDSRYRDYSAHVVQVFMKIRL